MPPPPPALFTTVRLVGESLFVMSTCSRVRAVLSLLPPGTEPAMISTFFCGDQLWAGAALATLSAMPATSTFRVFMSFSPRKDRCLLLQADRFHHFGIFLDFGADELAERFRRTALRLQSVVDEPFLDFGNAQDLRGFGVQP